MGKKIVGQIKLHIKAGKATPQPPIGPALGQAGVNIMEFCKAFNARTASIGDATVPTIITVFSDKSFTFVTKAAPVSESVRKAAGIDKGSKLPGRDSAGKITKSQVQKIGSQDGRPLRDRSRGRYAHRRGYCKEHGNRGR